VDNQAHDIVSHGLIVKPEALRAYAATLNHKARERYETTLTNMRTITTGCPALVAKGIGSETSKPKNVVVELHQWCLQIAKEYYSSAY
jgi:hypothetical protein